MDSMIWGRRVTTAQWRIAARNIGGILCLTMLVMAGATPAAANSKYASIVMGEGSGEVLYARSADSRRYPASLTKVMTLYMLFEELAQGRYNLDSKLKVSSRAAGQPPSKLGVKAGSTITVRDAIRALVVRSANDVAVVVAEAISGTERKFAQAMTKRARTLGMDKTTFRNASGLPNRRQVTTARDMAIMAQAVRRDYPQYTHFFEETSFSWGGRKWRTHNHVLKGYDGADGMKTGYTRASGYNLITTVEKDGVRLIGVVMGGRTSKRRDRDMHRILNLNYKRIAQRPDFRRRLLAGWPTPVLKPGSSGTVMVATATAAKKPALPDDSLVPAAAPETVIAVANLEVAPEPKPVAVAALEYEGVTPVIYPGSLKPAIPDTMPDFAVASLPIPAPAAEDDTAEEPALRGPQDTEDAEEDPIAARIAAVLGREEDATDTPSAAEPRTIPLEERAPALASLMASLESETVARSERYGRSVTLGMSDAGSRSSSLASLMDPIAEGDGHADGYELLLDNPSLRDQGIQIGAFLRLSTANRYIEDAMLLAPGVLTREKAAIVPTDTTTGQIFRARFGPFSEDDANTACGLLEAKGMDCFAIEEKDWAAAIRP